MAQVQILENLFSRWFISSLFWATKWTIEKMNFRGQKLAREWTIEICDRREKKLSRTLTVENKNRRDFWSSLNYNIDSQTTVIFASIFNLLNIPLFDIKISVTVI